MKLGWALLLALPAAAHTISMSHGVAQIEGSRLMYQLRIPAYELSHIQNPEQTLFSEIHFFSNGLEGRLLERSCRNEPDMAAFVCSATYEFPRPIDTLTVNCGLARVTVPNHIHLLRAIKGNHIDQAIFDNNTIAADLHFRPPTPFETAIRNIAAGVHRAATSFAGLVFLIVLALAARTAKEFAAVMAAFLAGQAISCAILPHIRFDPSPQFIVIAMLTTTAYLLVEIVFLREGSGRWLVCGVLGLFHGLYYALLLREGEYNAVYVLAGVFAVETLAAGIAYVLLSHLTRTLKRRRLTPQPTK
jgi:hypothetical protein